MEVGQLFVPMMAAALCIWALFQFVGYVPVRLLPTRQPPRNHRSERRSLTSVASTISSADLATTDPLRAAWQGYRLFKVAAIQREAESCHSVYLRPADGKPIAGFLPGQHLTIRLPMDDESKTHVRCYSLSSSFHPNFYRITVKAVASPMGRPELPVGLVSNYINHRLKEGATIEVKSPAGDFYLDAASSSPVILLAGGVGITPLMSMIQSTLINQPHRKMLLIYGSLNGQQHIFKHELDLLQRQSNNLTILNCYSTPLPEDCLGTDYQLAGRIDHSLLKQILPQADVTFYLCGPPPFMQSVYSALIDLGIDNSRIQFEAFGPASVERIVSSDSGSGASISHEGQNAADQKFRVMFAQSAVSAEWDSPCSTLLDLANQHDVPIETGCRAGSCGTCETRLLSGSVNYPKHLSIKCGAGSCLPCVAKPSSDIELEA